MLKKIVAVAVIVLLLPTLMIFISPFQNEEGDTLDVLIIDGQSNAAYGQDLIDLNQVNTDYPDAPTKKLYYYGTDSGPAWYWTHTDYENYALHPMYNDGWKVGGYEAGLGYILSQRSDHDTLISNIAVSGATVTELSPENPMWVYGTTLIENALNEVKALNEYESINMLGYVWAQGESDGSTPIKEYESKFMSIMKGLSKFGADECYIIATRARWGNSVAAQYDLANAYSNITITTNVTNTFTVADGTLKSDGVHYTQKGRDMIADVVGYEIDLNEPTSHDFGPILGAVVVVIIAGLSIALAGSIIMRRND